MVDYSKWKNIEISDDEDDTHPNIDTPSLFRWRHRARLERMMEMEKKKEDIKRKKQSCQARLMDVQERMMNKEGNEEDLKKELEKIESDDKAVVEMEEEYLKKAQKVPWNVDTISKPGFEKVCVNKKKSPKTEIETPPSEEECEEKMMQFVNENEELCKQYGSMSDYEESKRFLQMNPQLVCEECSSYLVVWSLNLAIENNLELVLKAAHQCVCMQYILELAKQLSVDPKACVASVFSKIQNAIPEYRTQFEAEVEGLKERIVKRSEEKIREICAELEEEDRKKRLGPGGLDPIEVFASLPDDLKKCFETKDIDMLQTVINQMPFKDARYHMKRCVDGGLWIPESPNSNATKTAQINENAEDADDEDDEDDDFYEDESKFIQKTSSPKQEGTQNQEPNQVDTENQEPNQVDTENQETNQVDTENQEPNQVDTENQEPNQVDTENQEMNEQDIQTQEPNQPDTQNQEPEVEKAINNIEDLEKSYHGLSIADLD